MSLAHALSTFSINAENVSLIVLCLKFPKLTISVLILWTSLHQTVLKLDEVCINTQIAQASQIVAACPIEHGRIARQTLILLSKHCSSKTTTYSLCTKGGFADNRARGSLGLQRCLAVWKNHRLKTT
jgi:hypothetical protein